jgi:methyl halide transferase
MATPADQRRKLQEMMQSDTIPNNEKWDRLYMQSVTPWDRGVPSPALVELLIDKHFPLVESAEGKMTQALVPGCGRGYDVVLFAGLSAPDQKIDKAVGLDLSSKATEEAKQHHANAPGNFEFLVGDFFSNTEDWAKAGPYDVVYDYTV